MTSDVFVSVWCRAAAVCLLLSSVVVANNEVFSVEVFPRENAKAHRTSAYEIVDSSKPAVVIRRGDPFYLALQLRKPYDSQRDKIRLEFMYGELLPARVSPRASALPAALIHLVIDRAPSSQHTVQCP